VNERRTTVVSIMGYSHSGSTVLDIALGNHPAIVGVGEVHKLPRSGWTRDDDRRCACGKAIDVCEFWPVVRDDWFRRVGDDQLKRYISLQNRFEGGRAAWPRLLREGVRHSAAFQEYMGLTTAFYEAIRDTSGKDIIVDASKPPVRNLALLLNEQLDVRIIHLVRDGRAVALSRSRPRPRDVEHGVPRDQPARSARSVALGWVVTNIESGRVLARAGRERSMRLTYEDLVGDPTGTMASLGRLTGVDLGSIGRALSEGEEMDVGHNVGGNALRMSGTIVLKPNLEWRSKLPQADEKAFWTIAGWLERRYGYSR
jgi:Sulfotransferase family